MQNLLLLLINLHRCILWLKTSIHSQKKLESQWNQIILGNLACLGGRFELPICTENDGNLPQHVIQILRHDPRQIKHHHCRLQEGEAKRQMNTRHSSLNKQNRSICQVPARSQSLEITLQSDNLPASPKILSRKKNILESSVNLYYIESKQLNINNQRDQMTERTVWCPKCCVWDILTLWKTNNLPTCSSILWQYFVNR